MPLPTGRSLHVDKPLTNISIAYVWRNSNAPFGMVADRVFPVVPVAKKSDVYYKYAKGDWYRGGARKRGPATQSAGIGFNLTTDNYVCDVWALHDDIAWQDEANQDQPLNLRDDSSELVVQNMLIEREVEWANTYFTTGVWATDKVGTSDFDKWSDYSNSDPGADIEEYKKLIERTTGFTPNKMVVGRDVHSKLKYHPLVKDQYKHTTAESITPLMIARVFEIDQYLVAGGIRNTGVEGGTDNFEFTVGSDDVLLVYANPAPALRKPSGGYTFAWTGYMGGAYGAPEIATLDMPLEKATRVEGEMAYVHKLVAADMGVFLSDVVD